MKDNSLACIDTSLFMQVIKVLSAAKDGVEEGMHHQSKELELEYIHSQGFKVTVFEISYQL